MTPAPVRHLVVDNQAVTALLSTATTDPTRAEVLTAVMAAGGRCVAPTAVRAEADWARSDPVAANANRLIPFDDPLDRPGADRDVELRRTVPTASLVDAAVAVAVERLPAADVVEVLTSDPRDLEALTDRLDTNVEIRRI